MLIKKNIKIFFNFLEKKERLNFYFIIFLQFIGSILEACGIALILPVLGIILGQETNLFSNLLMNYDGIFNFSDKENLLILSIFVILIFFIFKNFILTFIYKKIFSFAYNTQYKIKSKIYSHFIKQNYQKFTEKGSSEMISTISVDLNIFTQNFVVALLIFLTEFFVLLMISLLLLIIEPNGFFLVSFITLIFIYIFMKFFKKKINSLGEKKEEFEERMQKIINNSLNSFQITKIHNKENFFLEKFNFYNKETSFLYGKFMFFQNVPRLFFEVLIIVLLTILIFIMMKLNYNFDEIFVKVAIFSAAAFRVMPSINRLSYTYQGIIFSSSTLLKISALSKEIKNTKELLNINNENRLKLSNFNNELHLQNIFFKYGEKPILNNLNLKIKKGQAVGIYGVSGGGKTTLINIIAGLVSPDEGKILLDGKEVKVDNSDWQNFIGYVPQSVNLLDDTIINNITFCENNKNDDEFLIDVAKQAQILELIKDSGNKNVGERGLRISGGQLQRLSIARALYKKPSILIFDEATNALDESTEKKVFDTIYSLKGKVTLILISHNLNNLNKCDLKFKLNYGKLDKI